MKKAVVLSLALGSALLVGAAPGSAAVVTRAAWTA
jgi:hypothetical protein